MADLDKILVAGGHGMIGSHLYFGIKPSKDEFDATNLKSISKTFEKYAPSGVLCLFNLDIRASEQNPFEAYKINALGVYNLAKEAKKRNIPLILISTGAVFSGSIKDSFSEESFPNPLNVYGQSKYLAEIMALENSNKNIVVRTGWVFGANKDSKKKGIFDKMLDSAIEGKDVKVTYDQYGSPTYIKDFIFELKKLISNNSYGIYHVTNAGTASASEFVEEAINYLNSRSKMAKLSVSEFASNIKRSPSECLNSTKIKLRTWQEALKDYLSSEI